MIPGGFDNHGRPTARATPYFPVHGSAVPVTFLIDTGSTQTIVMPLDASRLRIDCSRLGRPILVNGIGGPSEVYIVKDVPITFGEGASKYTFETDVRVMDPGAHPLIKLPSILGAGVWRHWNLSICADVGHLAIDPRRSPDGL